MNMLDDKERIEYIIKDMGMTNVDFASRTGIAPATLSHITSGRSKPTLAILRGIIDGFPELSPEWVLMGTGPVYKDSKQSKDNTTDGGQCGEAQNDLFSANYDTVNKNRQKQEPSFPSVQQGPSVEDVVRTTMAAMTGVAQSQPRKVVEIRIFFDDGTYQEFK